MNDYEVAQHAHALPGRFADRLDTKNHEFIREFAAVGEWGEELDLLLTCLTRDQHPVTPAEHDELAELLTAMGQGTDQLDKLNVSG